MEFKLQGVGRSVSTKVFFIGVLVLILLIPVGMIKGVIYDRQSVSHDAEQDIMRAWGAEQLIAAPVLVLPYEHMDVTQYGSRMVRGGQINLLPDELNINVELRTDVLYRGIHKVPTYNAVLSVTGRFKAPDFKKLRLDESQVDWSNATIAVGVSDARAILSTPRLEFSGRGSKFESGGKSIAGLPPQIVAQLDSPFGNDGQQGGSFAFELNLNGTKSLKFLPLGDTTNVTINSSWPSPSFVGAYLPTTREVTDDGFTASWAISSLGRALPSDWIEGNDIKDRLQGAEFGVDIFMPVGLYQLSLRSTKYAVLFIGLMFVAYFLFEVMAGLRLHLLQYLMIGFANTLFYLLLLSLAEHARFGIAYLVSALASSGLIIAYSGSVLQQRQRAGLIAVVLLCLYCFLYMTLTAETYALLFGSVGLWFSLAVVMYLTRKVDWFGLAGERDGAAGTAS